MNYSNNASLSEASEISTNKTKLDSIIEQMRELQKEVREIVQNVATEEHDGLMSKEDKALLDTYTGDDFDESFDSKADASSLEAKQDALVSGTNIKTVNNTSILGSGNIDTTPTDIGTDQILDGAITLEKIEEGDIDDTPTEDSSNLISSGAVYDDFKGIDTSTIVKTLSPSTSVQTYTATQDCWLVACIGGFNGAEGYVTVDGVYVASVNTSGDGWWNDVNICVPIKKGQVVKYKEGYNTSSAYHRASCKFYAVKH